MASVGEIDLLKQRFSAIHTDAEWGVGSGPGAHPRHNLEYSALLQKFIVLNEVAIVVDFGCGDWRFSRHIDYSSILYS